MNTNTNTKRLLCYNMVTKKSCVYKNKCIFAHSIKEQSKDDNKMRIYNIIMKEMDLSNLDTTIDCKLFTDLLTFTKECKKCMINKCSGGFNCKYGVYDNNIKLCYSDLIYGKCLSKVEDSIIPNVNRCCNGIHLTDKKFIPHNQRLFMKSFENQYHKLNDDIYYDTNNNILSLTLNDNIIKLANRVININKYNRLDLINRYNNAIKYINNKSENLNNTNIIIIENEVNIDKENNKSEE